MLGLAKCSPYSFSSFGWSNNSNDIRQANSRTSNILCIPTRNSYKHGNSKDSEATLDILDKEEKGWGGVLDFRNEYERFTDS